MKKDKTFWVLEIGKWAFFLVVPIIMFILKCTTIGGQKGGTPFILTCSGYIVAIIIYIVFKKAILKNYLADLNGKVVNYTTQMETETDQEKIPLIEKALKKCLLIRSCFTVAPVVIVLGFLLTLVKALETDLITLYSVLGICVLSYILGFVCMLLQNNFIKSKNRQE